MEPANYELLHQGLVSFDLNPAKTSLQGIEEHLSLVSEWNQRINLTAIKDERDMVIKHVLDSAAALLMVNLSPGMRLLDVGTGAGFPGVTIKCLQPAVNMTLLDSLAKRCKFLETVREALGPIDPNLAHGLEIVWGRAEDKAHEVDQRQRYDLVVARAVAQLRILSEYCLPFCRVGGQFLAMKGPNVVEEVAAADKAIRTLGGEIQEIREVSLPEGAGSRTLILVRKVSATPKAFPRKAGSPEKSPL